MKMVRRLRVLEYVGTEEWVNTSIEHRHIKGCMAFSNGSIREALVGETNELMLLSEMDMVAEQQRKAKV